MTRLEANRAIIALLSAAVESSPDSRFGQILRNLEAIKQVIGQPPAPIHWANEFYLESEQLLKRIQDAKTSKIPRS